MAHRLSFERMNLKHLFFRAIAVLGLLLAAQLAHAGAPCVSAGNMEAMAWPTAFGGACPEASAACATCIAMPKRIDASASAGRSLPFDPEASAAAPYHASVIPFAAVQPRWSAGPAPGFPPPVYIRFGRFLS